MRRDRTWIGGAAAALVVSAALLAACGGDDTAAPAERKAPKLASVETLAKDPYAIACAHIRDQERWADATRRATVALGDRERIRGLNRLQTTQSLFYAMTELCRGRPASFEPANAAVRAVRQGTYRADLGTP